MSKLDMKTLVEKGTLTAKEADFLKEAVESKKNILVSGGTGSGKTTFVKVLSEFIPKELTVATIENYQEIQIDRDNITYLEAQGKDFSNSIKLLLSTERPDYLVVNDMRGNGYFELCEGMVNTDKGIMVTLHGESHFDALTRFMKDVIDTKKASETTIKEWIGNGLDLIVYTNILKDGTRQASIMEVIQYKEETDSFVLKLIAL